MRADAVITRPQRREATVAVFAGDRTPLVDEPPPVDWETEDLLNAWFIEQPEHNGGRGTPHQTPIL